MDENTIPGTLEIIFIYKTDMTQLNYNRRIIRITKIGVPSSIVYIVYLPLV